MTGALLLPSAPPSGPSEANGWAGATPIPPEQHFVFHSLTWERFQQFCQTFPDTHFRLTYDRGRLEILATTALHARLNRLLLSLLLILTEELNVPRWSGGDMTCGREDLGRALQPDDCFYLANEPRVRGLSFPADPPPDLAIEIEVSQTVLDRLAVLAALGVPEVWRFDGQQLRVLRLQGDATYAEMERSQFFPQMPLQELVDSVRERQGTIEEGRVMKDLRAWVRQRMAANWQPATGPGPGAAAP
jgi:Uma2 family endonuclease